MWQLAYFRCRRKLYAQPRDYGYKTLRLKQPGSILLYFLAAQQRQCLYCMCPNLQFGLKCGLVRVVDFPLGGGYEVGGHN